MLSLFAHQELLFIIDLFARHRLTATQKKILHLLKNTELDRKPVTQIVRLLSQQLNSSASTIWLNLNQLKALTLVSYGGHRSKGIPLKLTPIGAWIAENINTKTEANGGTK